MCGSVGEGKSAQLELLEKNKRRGRNAATGFEMQDYVEILYLAADYRLSNSDFGKARGSAIE